jgi:NADH:ubiquinone oxidoreductase subunit 4 (subunit M)
MALSIPYLLSIITFLPLLGALLVLVVPGDSAKKWLAFGVSLVTFVVSLRCCSTGRTAGRRCSSSKM